MDRSPWTALDAATEAARFGHKAATLARLRHAGLPVVDGLVLDADSASTALDEPDALDRAVAALLADERIDRWILRSSSPLEDRPGRSAAGWFASAASAASPDELRRALRTVLRSARAPRLVRQLGEIPPLAVLAQEELRLDRWCTAEFRRGALLYEGLADGGRAWSAEASELFDPIVRRAVEHSGIDPALLELGATGDRVWVLQLRPAPSRAPRPDRTPPRETAHEGLGAAVHPGDADREWEPDLEHCPTPLSVLLATAFGRWIAADPDHTPSRLVHGRWHDPAGAREPADRPQAHAAWERWRRQLAERVQPALRTLQRREAALGDDPASWRRFHDAWFALQQAYFAMPGGRARAWARRRLGAGRAALEHTPAADRIRRWNDLHRRLAADPDGPPASAEAIARWIDEHEDHPLAREIEATARRDRAVAPLPYDGFTPGLDEDPWPLYRALASGLPEPSMPAPSGPEEELAAAILALAETDNELLLEAYALWRSAIRRVADRRDVEAVTDLHMLDVVRFERWLDGDGGPPAGAVRQGRALHAAWAQAPTGERGASGNLRGRAAAPGTARGAVERGRSLLELEGDGRIAVVDTLGPADAIAVPRFAAVVCAAGDVLGHASVLCREFGIPCVVGVPGARQALARAGEVLVDGDRGTVRILD